MDPNGRRQVFIVHQPPQRPIRRTMSLGDRNQGQSDGRSSVLLSAATHYVSSPIMISSMGRCQQQQFAPYQADMRQRSNSTSSQRQYVVMQPAKSQGSLLPVYSIQSGNTGNTMRVVSQSSTSMHNGVTVAPSSRPTLTRRPLLPTERVLCNNCGIQSTNISVCQSCSKKICSNAIKITVDSGQRLSTSSGDAGKGSGISSSSFYNGTNTGQNDFLRFVHQTSNTTTSTGRLQPNRKRTNVGKAKLAKLSETVTITISSDSSDNEEVEKKEPSASPAPSRPSTPDDLRDGETPPKRQKQDHDAMMEDKAENNVRSNSPEQTRESSLEVSDETLAKSTLNLKLDSIRVGQMKLTPLSVMRISSQDISISAFCQDTKTELILHVPWSGVTNCDLCIDPREPSMYIVLDTAYVPPVRETLGMKKGCKPYYDPGGKDDEKLFVFFFNSVFIYSSQQCNFSKLERKIELIRKRLKRSLTFCKRIQFEESGSRLMKAAMLSIDNPTTPTITEPSRRCYTVPIPTSTTSHQIVTRNQTKTTLISEDLKFMFTGPRVKLFAYPPPPATGGITVTNEDQFCLNEGEFLNDVIIDFYLKYLSNHVLSPRDRERSHFFSCFFYERLMQKTAAKMKDISHAERRHNQVKKWTRNVDLFSKDFIFIPINESSHWYLVVICFPSLVGMETTYNLEYLQERMKMNAKKSTAPEQVLSPLPKSMEYLEEYCDDNDADDESSEVKGRGGESGDGAKIGNSEVKNETETDVNGLNGQAIVGSKVKSSIENIGSGVDGQNLVDNAEIRNDTPDLEDVVCDRSSSVVSSVAQKCEGSKLIKITFPKPVKGMSNAPQMLSVPSQSTSANVACVENSSVTRESGVGTSNRTRSNEKETNSPEISSKEIMSAEISSGVSATPTSNSEQSLEICVIPGSPKFTLSDDLKGKCIISPNKTVRVILPRTLMRYDQNEQKNGHDLSSNQGKQESLLSSDRNAEPVIVLSSTSDCSDQDENLRQDTVSKITISSDETNEFSSKAKSLCPKKNRFITKRKLCLKSEDLSATAENSKHQNSLLNEEGDDSLCLHFQTSTHELSDCDVTEEKQSIVSTITTLTDEQKVNSEPEVDSEEVENGGDVSHILRERTIKKRRKHYIPVKLNIAENKGESVIAFKAKNSATAATGSKLPEKSVSTVTADSAICIIGSDLTESAVGVIDPTKSAVSVIGSDPTESAVSVIGSDSTESAVNVNGSESTDLAVSVNISEPFDSAVAALQSPSKLKLAIQNDHSKQSDCTITSIDSQGQIADSKSEKTENKDLFTVTKISIVEENSAKDNSHETCGDCDEINTNQSKTGDIHCDDNNRACSGIVASLTPTQCDAANAGESKQAEDREATQTEKKTVGENALKEERQNKGVFYKKPCILVFDSLRGPSRSKVVMNIREYISMEWNTRKKATDGEKSFNKDTLKMCSVAVPQQDNYTDCGVFLLHYVEKFFSNPINNFYLPIKDLVSWFDPKECITKREEMKKITMDLHEEWITRHSK